MFYFNPIFCITIMFCCGFITALLCSLFEICLQDLCLKRQNISIQNQPQHEPQQEDNIKEYIVIKNPGGHPISIGIV